MHDANDLAFFALLLRHPSLAAGAQELGVTPPAVSRRLAALEKRLGVRLLQRSTRRLSLTPEGSLYLAEGQRILGEIEDLERALVQGQDCPRGLLRVSAGFGFGRQHLAPAIAEFATAYPDVMVHLILADRTPNPVAEGFDVSIRFGEPPDSRILARRLAGNQRVLCAAPSYLAQYGVPDAPRALTDHQCIVIRENETAYGSWTLCRGKQRETVKVGGRLATNHGEIAAAWALAGHGIMLRSAWHVAPDIRAGRLVRVLAPWRGVPADIYALYPQRLHLSAKVRVFLDFLAARFEGYRQQGAGDEDLAPW